MFETLKSDIRCIRDRDPACKSGLEAFLCYPGLRAVRAHRCAHWLHTRGFKLLARMNSSLCRFFTGVDIHPGAVIGERLFIDHAQGVVIGETAVIGDDVTIYQGATLGGTGKQTGKRHPTIGSHVTISAGASVLGPLTVGDYAKVGAGAVVLNDVPAFATVVGVPGRVVRMRGCPIAAKIDCACTDKESIQNIAACTHRDNCAVQRKCTDNARRAGEAGVDLDQVHLPDPVEQEIHALEKRIQALETLLSRQ